MTFLDNLKNEGHTGLTENGAKTYTSTLVANLDFFAQAGSMRSRVGDVRNMFAAAFDEDPELALRNLVHLRNIRLGGLGERAASLEAYKYLIDTRKKKLVCVMLDYVAYVGRWADLMTLIEYGNKRSIHFVEKHGVELIRTQLESDLQSVKDGKSISLLAKWLPNITAHEGRKRRLGQKIANSLGFEGDSGLRKYRKMLVVLRDYLNIIEVRLASKEYHKIDLNQVPSKALFKYRKALQKHMPDEYEALLQSVESGEKKMSAKLMLPHEIIRAYGSYRAGSIDRSLEATWKSLDDVLKGVEDNAIVVADTSGSMTGSWGYGREVEPWDVAEGLAIYTAERLKGTFHNHFITFSTKPRLIELPADGTLLDKMKKYADQSEVSDTNIQATFDLILDTAVKNNTPQEELPSKLLIISDMEFNQGVSGSTNFEQAKRKFNNAGYKLPDIVFWNVDSRQDNVPVQFNESGVALVSGFSTNILNQVLGGKISSPVEMMLQVLEKPEYDFVAEALVPE